MLWSFWSSLNERDYAKQEAGQANQQDPSQHELLRADFSNKAPGKRKQRSPLRARSIVLCVTPARIDNLNHRGLVYGLRGMQPKTGRSHS
jgi:hypothetical protein